MMAGEDAAGGGGIPFVLPTHDPLPPEPGGDDATANTGDYHITRDRSAYGALTERGIPVRTFDLERLILADPALAAGERQVLGRLFRMLASVLHHEYHALLLRLKDLYAPLDPDSDSVELPGYERRLSEGIDEQFLDQFQMLLVRANYHPLSLDFIEEAVAAPNELGLNYVPDFDLFEHLMIWVRGATLLTRPVRSIKTRFRKKYVRQEGFRRLIVMLKFKPGRDKDLGEYARSDVVYLRLFKDVPRVDMEMHLPEQGTKVKMRMVDKAQIASPVAMGLPTMAMKLLTGASLLTLSYPALGALLAAPISAGVNSFFGFKRAQQRHLHHMIRHLYYLTLANNASVVTRLVDSAEEEELKEAILAYFALWRGQAAASREPWDATRLDRAVERWLADRAGLTLDFEIGDALEKLLRLGLARRDEAGRLAAVSPGAALAALDARWDRYYNYDVPEIGG
jgi:hypothetical protein